MCVQNNNWLRLRKGETLAKQIGVRFDDRFKIAMKNKKFRVYKMLLGHPKSDETMEEFKKRHRKYLFKKISSYKISDYKELFKICDFLEKKENVTNLWGLSAGLELVFEILEDNDSSYVDIISEYLNANAPLRLNRYRQINRMLEIIGYDGTYKLVNSKKFDKLKTGKHAWSMLINCLLMIMFIIRNSVIGVAFIWLPLVYLLAVRKINPRI